MDYCLGIDVSKDTLQVSLMKRIEPNVLKVIATHRFINQIDGFASLKDWVVNKSKSSQVHYVMEATGVYHESLADWLYAESLTVTVELPNKIKHFSKSLNIKSKTDKVDANIIARYGLERCPRAWEPMTKDLSSMRALSRQIYSFKKERTRYKNRLHALTHTSRTPELVIEQVKAMIISLDDGIKEMEKEVFKLAEKDNDFIERVRKVATIKGVREFTIICVLCETNGFFLCENSRQVVSYAGLDVQIYQSGDTLKQGGISKKGNAKIRQLLYVPALAAGYKGENSLKSLYQSIAEQNPNAKKHAISATDHKPLILH